MELTLYRFANAKDYTYGVLYEGKDKYPLSFTLEDEKRSEKVRGETRIPTGRYEIKLREVVSGLTQKYRNNFAWFTYHLELQDVPGFNYVYMHRGNTDEHTDGCILLANTCDLTPPTEDGFVGERTKCFEKVYKQIETLLRLKREKIFINLKNY